MKKQRNVLVLIIVNIVVIHFMYDLVSPYDHIPARFETYAEWHVDLIRAPVSCPNATTLYLIKTAPYNFKLRELTRKLAAYYQHASLVFIIGRRRPASSPNSQRDEERLNAEIDKYDDFVVGDFIDSYETLTVKTLTAYTYAQRRCGDNVKWLVLADDDTVIEHDMLRIRSPLISPLFCT